MHPDSRRYTLVICEKPDAARRVSEALADGVPQSSTVDGTTVYRLASRGEDFVVCSAQGHVYGLSDPFEERTVYPVFDAEWYPLDLVSEERSNAARRISAIKKMAAGASRFINACDFDVEGETIGYNLLRYACDGKEEGALRAKFSTLTKEELLEAFQSASPNSGQGLALAGRARHLIDFVWGVNLSRILSQSTLNSGQSFRTVSVGRVQGPTLNFLVQRELEVREFVPIPYWNVIGMFEKDGKKMEAGYSFEKVETKVEADAVRNECVGKDGVVVDMRRSVSLLPPPAPFNIGELQKEAFRCFGYTPSRTLQIAEGLYLAALISYPRTGSQVLPPAINYGHILRRLSKINQYSRLASVVLQRELRPSAGSKGDPAHPAIHPTGETPKRALGPSPAAIFDLVVRRFLANFGPSAKRESVTARIAVGNHQFRLSGSRTVSPGWIYSYGRYASVKESETPDLTRGEKLGLVEVKVSEKFTERPHRYNEGSLLEKMERENIGTKATRADTITTLVKRGYVTGGSMEVSDLGLSVVEVMNEHAPSIITTQLTKEIEERLEAIESSSSGDPEIVRETVGAIAAQLVRLNSLEEKLSREMEAAIKSTVAASYVLGPCPVCGTGQLRIIRSRKTRKRFVGCSNYPSKCRASAPLPQRGTIKTTTKRCEHCSWPIVYVSGGRFPWRLCVNANCPGKVKKK